MTLRLRVLSSAERDLADAFRQRNLFPQTARTSTHVFKQPGQEAVGALPLDRFPLKPLFGVVADSAGDQN
jgi:hypothetical protein